MVTTYLEELERRALDLEYYTGEYLRERGWVYTSSNPAHLNLWTISIDGRTLAVPPQQALAIQKAMDEESQAGFRWTWPEGM